jgi:NAD-dependent deacetylase
VTEPSESYLIDRVAARLTPGARVTVLTGAGVSAASGVPTFRGTGGLWRSYRPEELATPDAFARDPTLVWEWYDWRRQLIAACRPNAAHDVLASWSHRFPRFTLITQNVDGLHERAGTMNVLRLHGSIWEVMCWSGCPASPSRWRDERVPLPALPARCTHCGGLIRPGVVWFGESIDSGVMNRCLDATGCDVFLTIGTSAVVHPAAAFVHQARSRGAFTVEINVETTPASGSVDLALQGSADVILAAIDRRSVQSGDPGAAT